MIKILTLRLFRKTAHLINKMARNTSHLSSRVEHKATKLLTNDRVVFYSKRNSVIFDELYYEHFPQIIPIYPSLPLLGRRPTVTLLIPTMNKDLFFGGVATAIMASTLLAKKKNFDLRIVQTFKSSDANVSKFIQRMNIDFRGRILDIDMSQRAFGSYANLDIHPDDTFMASSWGDVYVLNKLPLKKKFVYLIQDFEPIFYNNSDERALAESTYSSDKYIALCNTKLMYDFLLSKQFSNVKNGTWFEPAVSRYNSEKKVPPGNKRKIFIYGRPRVKRNLFFTTIDAVNRCFSEQELDVKDWEVFMGGQDDIPDLQLGCGLVVRNLGKMNLEDYYEFIGSVDIAVSSMMAPHPNYPTLELASAGAAVVTTKYDIKQDLTNYSKNIITVDISPSSIAQGIKKAASLQAATRLENAKESNISQNWEEALDKPLNRIIKGIG